ncbi:MAG TPA: methyl-accepting chemotaxis protein [Patescibacteria group bacterium]|nr:methyl-accepting chemotaxis protein [Patescibacteria group bacterium]
MKIGAKIMGGFLIVVFLMLLSGGFTYYLLNAINASSDILQDNMLPRLLKTERLGVNSALKVAAARGYLITGQEKYIDDYKKIARDDEVILQELAATSITAEGRKLTADVKAADEKYERILFDKVFPLYQAGRVADAIALMPAELAPAAEVKRTLMEEYVKLREQQINSGFDAAQAAGRQAQMILLVSVLVAFVVGIGISLGITRAVTGPLREADSLLAKMAGGDFSVDVSAAALNRKDEMGNMARAMKNLIDSMRDVVRSMAVSAETLAASSEELSASVVQSAQGADSVAASSEEISSGLQTVSASAEEITASAENMGANLTEISHSASGGNQVAKGVEQQALNLQQSAHDSRQTAVTLYDEISLRVLQAIADAKIVDEISGMASSIAAIAGQTNLLALNAAIEAARAGEQGRGFAVVAEEVRKLAEESAKAVGGIQELTKKVQAAIGVLVDNSDELLRFINETVRKDYDAFVNVGQQYKKDADSFLNITSDIGEKLHQVSDEMNEINRAIESVASTIEESSTGTQVIARGTSEVSQSLQEVNRAASTLANTAGDLNQMVLKFRV